MIQRITKERTCPVCKGSEAYRIRRTGISVKVICRLLNLRPHYCPDCDTYFLGPRHSREMRTEPFGSSVGPHASGQPEPSSLPH
jgi:hypothetical protein